MRRMSTDSLRRGRDAILDNLSRRSSRNRNEMHFSWDTNTPHLVVTADTPDFDPTTIQRFKDEGFETAYLPYNGVAKEYKNQLQVLEDPLELGEKYAIVAYGEAAALVLEACTKPMPKLRAVVAYYPTRIPNTSTGFPSSLRVQVHLADTRNNNFGTKHTCYTYEHSQPGFAEHDLDEYDEISDRLAWSRTIGCLREGFKIANDLEPVWDRHVNMKYVTKDLDGTISTTVEKPYVNYVPVMLGGDNYDELCQCYKESFIPKNPPSLKLRLISRTVGTDQIVDEMYLSFQHTQEVPWMLPGIPATDKQIEVAIVSVVAIHGGKISHENIYWDQASVLVQLGLLDPKHVPGGVRFTNGESGGKVERLPVVGAESAQKVLNKSSHASNQLLGNSA